MNTLVIHNIPDDLYDQLRRHAEMNRRSIDDEVRACIEKAMGRRRTTPEAVLIRARRLREKTRDHPITDEELTHLKKHH